MFRFWRIKKQKAFEEASLSVGLEDRARSKLKMLPGGMLCRVGVAQAIVNKPDLLLLNESTTRLDPEQRVDFRTLVREFGERGTVIVSTHLAEVALMEGGNIVFRVTKEELVTRGEETGAGDSLLDRGYTPVLAEF